MPSGMSPLIYTTFLVVILVAHPAFGAEEVIFAQIVHRHGSRTPIVPANKSILCPQDVGCGMLNEQGMDMLRELGGYLRSRYGGTFFASSTSPRYNLKEITSRSTAVPRTLQSADALLRGLYNNITAFYPVIDTDRLSLDTLLHFDAMPSYGIYYRYIEADLLATLDRTVCPRLFPSNATIAVLAAEAHLEGYCATVTPARCLLAVQDIASSLYSAGGLGTMPTMVAELDNLQDLVMERNKLIFAYNSSLSLDQQRGSAGQPLVAQMIANFQSFINKNITTKFLHYSAHERTVMPFCVTVGDPAELRPPFGAMYILELIADGGAYYVRGTKGAPGQSPSNHTYTTGVLRLGGINANGTTYWTSTATDRVPLADFSKFVASTAPQSPLGSCYLPPAALSFIGCDTLRPGSSTCINYRQLCPAVGCPSESYLANTVTYDCVFAPPSSSSDPSCLPKPDIAILAAGTAIGGVLLGAVITILLKWRAARPGHADKNINFLTNEEIV